LIGTACKIAKTRVLEFFPIIGPIIEIGLEPTAKTRTGSLTEILYPETGGTGKIETVRIGKEPANIKVMDKTAQGHAKEAGAGGARFI